MPATQATGVFNAQQADLVDMISQSTAFTSWCAPDDPLTHIVRVSTEKSAIPRPRAIVAPSKSPRLDDFGYATGSNVVIFEMDVPPEFAKTNESENGPDPVEIYTQFENLVSDVVSDVVQIARTGGHLMLGPTTRLEAPWRSDLDENDDVDARLDYLVCRIQFSWGPK
jgi:hypothetical protein